MESSLFATLGAVHPPHWWGYVVEQLALAVLNLGVIAGARRVLRRRPFFRTGNGARLLAGVTTVLEVAALVAAGLPLGVAAGKAFLATFTASGGYSLRPRRKRAASPVVAVPPAPPESTP